MGRKNVLMTYKMLDNADLSGDLQSIHTNTINLDKASIQMYWTGTSPSGTVSIEATNEDPEKASSEWRELNFGSAITISGNTGNHDIVFNELPFRAFRIVYTATSGVGTITATLSAKVTGA